MRHVLTLADLTLAEINRIFAITEDLKQKFAEGVREPLLPGRVAALIFQHPSLRTRASFEALMAHLGGSSIFLGDEAGFKSRESVADFGRVLSEYVDVIVVRAKKHDEVVELAKYCTCPVVNGLTDFAHPCQALGDLFTLRELLGKLAGHKLVSLRGAAAVYTDVWSSMGQEAEREKRLKVFAPYQVNAKLLKHAPRDAYFMHDLPARRGEEVTDEVIDGPRSIVLRQAANRMHAQKGLLVWLLGAKPAAMSKQ
ncbi:MAG: ornithine carbamoyltransferase [Planctomycetia bacterium]|nr:ornithine carbamoyltransferase [Planctomycetia bacterium]